MSQFRFTIINGLVETVIDEPIGWDTGLFNVNRDKEMHGLFFAYTTALEFVDSGYTTIKEVFDVDGVRTLLFLRIELDCDQTDNFEQIYYGKLDFSTDDELSGDYCSIMVNVSESIEEVLLKDNRGTKYNITKDSTLLGEPLVPIPSYDITTREKQVEIETDYLALIDKKNAIPLQTLQQARFGWGLMFATVPANVDTFDGDDPSGSDWDTFDNVLPNLSGHHIWKSPVDGTVRIDVNITGQIACILSGLGDTQEWEIGVKIYRNEDFNDTTRDTVLFFGTGDRSSTRDYIYQPEFKLLNVNEGDTIGYFFYLLTNFNTVTPSGEYTYAISNNINAGSYFNITFNQEFKDTISQTFLIHDVFRRISQNILNKENAFYSELLGAKNTQGYSYPGNGCAAATSITNGYNLRGFKFEEKPLFDTFDDAYTSLNSIWNTGIGIETIGGERRIRIEPKEYFYNFDPSISLSFIKEIRYNFFGEYIYDKITIGYEEYGTEEGTEKTGTIDSFATKREYKTPFVGLSNSKSIELFSKWVADHYTIEFTRRKQVFTSGSSSWKFDENNFIICLSREYDGTPIPQNEQAENFDIVSGISTPDTSYNLRIAPANNLLRWSNFIFSGYKPTDLLKFTYGTVHIPMETRMINEYCDGNYNNKAFFQNQDLSPTDENIETREPLLMPRIASFTYPLSWTQYKTIRDNPTKAIQFNKNGVDNKLGFIQSLNYSPVTGEAQFVLIVAKAPRVLCTREYGDPDYVECGYSD